MPGAFGTADEATLKAAPAAGEPGTDGVDLVAEVTHAEPYTVGSGRTASSPTTSASRRRSCATSARSPPSRWCRLDAAAEVLARAAPTACSSRTARRPGSGALRGRHHRRSCSARCRCSASASATSSWPGARRRDVQAAVRSPRRQPPRCGTWPPGKVEITSQNHNFAVDADSLLEPPTSRTSTSTTASSRGCVATPGLQRAVPPRGRPGPTTRLPLRPVRAADGELEASAPDAARDDLETILLIGSGPIVIGQACEFDYSGTQACRVLRDEGYRVVLANSNPATIMTDPEFADRTYVEPLDAEVLTSIIERERPDAVLPTLGGQTALNLAMELAERACSTAVGVELIGANAEAIATAEDRERFKQAMIEIGLRVPASGWPLARRGHGSASASACR